MKNEKRDKLRNNNKNHVLSFLEDPLLSLFNYSTLRKMELVVLKEFK